MSPWQLSGNLGGQVQVKAKNLLDCINQALKSPMGQEDIPKVDPEEEHNDGSHNGKRCERNGEAHRLERFVLRILKLNIVHGDWGAEEGLTVSPQEPLL